MDAEPFQDLRSTATDELAANAMARIIARLPHKNRDVPLAEPNPQSKTSEPAPDYRYRFLC